ncbi:MAG: hypothetical protein OEZ54_02460 [Gemmatimonadota bacterium]|nr:hypothetical protein [Gemmatimonadota bacterium]
MKSFGKYLAAGSAAAFLFFSTVSLDAQVTRQELGQPTGRYVEGLGMVSGVRELPNGMLLVADALGRELLLVNMDDGTAEIIGREGSGPDEYRQPDGVFALPGDSTLFVDLGNARLTVIDPELDFGATTPIAQEVQGGGQGPMGGVMIVMPRGVDLSGSVVFQALGGMGPGGTMPDSAPVVKWNRTTGRVDTLALVGLPARTVRSSGAGTHDQRQEIRSVPLSPQDGFGFGPNGSLAVARANPYRLDWVHGNGEVVLGRPVEYSPVRIRRADQEAWIEETQGTGLSVGITVENGARSMAFSRGGGGSERQPEDYTWPAVKPPFRSNGVWVAPDGKAWVERYVAAGDAPQVDIFDERGNRISSIVLPMNRRISGFGEGVVFLWFTDEMGLAYLERYRMP